MGAVKLVQGTWEGEDLVAEALEAPALYRGLSTEYADVGRLVDYLGDRLFSGLVRVTLPGREGHVLLFRGRPQAARYRVEGRQLEAAEAVRALLADSRWMDGEMWVHQLPEELFPEDWEDRQPLPWDAVEAVHAHPEEVDAKAGPAELAVDVPAPEVVVHEPTPAQEVSAPAGPVGEQVQAPHEAAAPAQQTVDALPWVRVLEGLVARFKRYRGPSAASRLEAEVNAALQGSGLRLQRGRVEGEVRDPEALRLATVRAVGFIKGMAGQTFAEQTLAVAMTDAGIKDQTALRSLLGS